MVKLLRLQSNIGTLNFDSILQDSFIIDENSQIGLLSVSWQKFATTLFVTDKNNIIAYSIEQFYLNGVNTLIPIIREFRLTPKEYTINNAYLFLEDLKKHWNNNLVSTIPKAVGTQIWVYLENQKVIIRSTQSGIIDWPAAGGTDDYRILDIQDVF